jgi:hypothetical protein
MAAVLEDHELLKGVEKALKDLTNYSSIPDALITAVAACTEGDFPLFDYVEASFESLPVEEVEKLKALTYSILAVSYFIKRKPYGEDRVRVQVEAMVEAIDLDVESLKEIYRIKVREYLDTVLLQGEKFGAGHAHCHVVRRDEHGNMLFGPARKEMNDKWELAKKKMTQRELIENKSNIVIHSVVEYDVLAQILEEMFSYTDIYRKMQFNNPAKNKEGIQIKFKPKTPFRYAILASKPIWEKGNEHARVEEAFGVSDEEMIMSEEVILVLHIDPNFGHVVIKTIYPAVDKEHEQKVLEFMRAA